MVRIRPVPTPLGFEAAVRKWSSPVRWQLAYNKLAVWKLTEWDRVIFMDADAIVTRSIDWLFRRPLPWSAQEIHDLVQGRSVAGRRSQVARPPVCTPVPAVVRGATCRRSAAGWGYVGYGNSGLFGLAPSESTYHDLLTFLRASNVSEVLAQGDQCLLAHYFEARHAPGPAMLEPWIASMGRCAHPSYRVALLSGYRACVGKALSEDNAAVDWINHSGETSLHPAYSHKPEHGPSPQPAYAAAHQCIGMLTALGAQHADARPSSLEVERAIHGACSAAATRVAALGIVPIAEVSSSDRGLPCAIL